MINYDPFAEQYNAIVQKRGPKTSEYIVRQLEQEADLTGKRICDLGCGQGELACLLNQAGAKVTGIDISKKLLAYARNLTDEVDWAEGDAMKVSAFQDEAFDIVVSSLMLMDVSDHLAVFSESFRILKPNGIMFWMVMHPCFHSPFCILLEDGSRHVSHYAPQYWKSKGKGTLRSVLGSYHRPISVYVNDFMKAGFVLERILEPGSESQDPSNTNPHSLPSHFGALGRKRAGSNA